LAMNDRSKFRAKKEDIVALLDAVHELFQEHKDNVTPKEVAERMGEKLHKQIPLHLVTETYTSLGFIAKKAIKHGEGSQIIPNPELLADKRAQFCKDAISSNSKKPKP